GCHRIQRHQNKADEQQTVQPHVLPPQQRDRSVQAKLTNRSCKSNSIRNALSCVLCSNSTSWVCIYARRCPGSGLSYNSSIFQESGFSMAFNEPVLTKRIPLDPNQRKLIGYDDYVKTGGYVALRKALDMKPDEIIKIMIE